MPAGRPRLYETPDLFYAKAMEYFQHCIDNNISLPNIAGLSDFMDMDTDTYYLYKSKPEFIGAIKRIEAKLENIVLNAKDTIKSIFYLKNKFKYVDKQETDLNVSQDKPFEVSITVSKAE